MQYAVQRWPFVVYDGTNSAEVMTLMTDYRLVSEADGVLTLGFLGDSDDGATWLMHTGDVACAGGNRPAADFQAGFHVLPDPESTP